MLDSSRKNEGWSSSPRHYSYAAPLMQNRTEGCGSQAKLSFTHQGPSSHSTCPTAGWAVDTLSIIRLIQVCRRPGHPEVSSICSEMASGRKHRATGGTTMFGDGLRWFCIFNSAHLKDGHSVGGMRLKGNGYKHTELSWPPRG